MGDVVCNVGEMRLDAAEEAEHQLRVRDTMVDIAELVGEGLHALPEVKDGAITLHHGVEFMVEEDGTRFLICTKEAFNGEPDIPRGLVVVFHGEIRNGVIEPNNLLWK